MARLHKTYSPKASEIERAWHVVDATDLPLGRLASHVAQLLRGKHKPTFAPHMDGGDFVIVINASKIAVTGNKEEAKRYYNHSGFPGGLRELSLRDLRERYPERIIEGAVRGMIPKNRLGRQIMTKLKVYPGPEHPHEAQNPQPLTLDVKKVVT